MTRFAALLLVCLLAALPARAQDGDGEGFLTRKIQDLLSGAGREVDITGFRGALSSRATLDRMTIADDDGVWLELREAELDWNRSALLRGRLEVTALTASSIVLTRLPKSDAAPKAEASGFSIPDLPVSIEIGELSVGSVQLGEAVIGQAVTLSVQGSASLDDGGADVDLAVTRTDRPGEFAIKAAFDPDEQALALDVSLQEPEGGVIARLLDIPDRPSVRLTVAGTGPLDDYRADIDLDTAGEDRLTGLVTLAADGAGGRRFAVELGGDVTALAATDYRDFFGTDIGLAANGTRAADGALVLDTFRLTSAALQLRGEAAIGADGQPQSFAVTGTVADPDGKRVTLPFGQDITVEKTELDVSFDASQSDAVTGEFVVTSFAMPGYAVNSATLGLQGSIATGDRPAVGLDVTFDATGVAAEDPAVTVALGSEIAGAARIDWTQDQPVRIRGLTLDGATYGAALDADVVSRDGTTELRSEGRATVQDLSAFAPLTGTDLEGAAELRFDINADVLGGTFRLVADGTTEGLALGIEQVDPLIAPPATLRVDAERTTEGLTLNEFTLANAELGAEASGRLADESGVIDFSARLRNAGIFTGTESGPVTLTGQLQQRVDGLHVSATGEGSDLRIGIEQVDRLLEGGAQLNIALLAGEEILLETAEITTPQAEITANGTLTDGARRLDFGLLLRNSALFTGGQAGALDLTGVVEQQGTSYQVTASGGGTDLGIGNPKVDPLFAGRTDLQLSLLAGTRILIQEARIANPQMRVTGSGELTEGARQVEVTGLLENPGLFTGAPSGPVNATVTAAQTGEMSYALTLDGTVQDLAIGNPQVDPLLAGTATVAGAGSVGLGGETPEILVERLSVDAPQLVLSASGNLTEGARDVEATARLTNSAIFTGGEAGPVDVSVTARQDGDLYRIALDGSAQDAGIGNPQVDPLLAGASTFALEGAVGLGEPLRLLVDSLTLNNPQIDLTASGNLTDGARDIQARARLTNSAVFTGGNRGPVEVTATARQDGADYVVAIDGSGQNIGIGNAGVDPLLPGQSDFTFRGTILDPMSGTPAAQIETLRFDGQALDVTASGAASQSAIDVTLDARIDDIGRIAPGINGPFTVKGDVGREGDTTRVDIRADGPGGINATVTGRVLMPGNAVALDVAGSVPLALANAFIAPRSLAGIARFDLRVEGPPALESLAGRVSLSGARLVAPELQLVVDNIAGGATLSGGRATLDLTAGFGGGQLAISGPIGLTAPYRADLNALIRAVRYERPGLASTLLNGQAQVSGPLTGGGTVSGVIGLSDTEVRIPSGSGGALTEIPDIVHIAEPADVRRSRARAGLVGEDAPDASGGGTGGASGGLALDLLIRTDESIFVRGRGLDAELRGDLRLEGTTSDVRPVGTFELVRGRLNILTKRLDLVEGQIALAGSFEPTIRLVAQNDGTEYTIQVILDGAVSDPQISFRSQPELPEDEVLSQLFFDRDLQSLSVLQAARLAAAVAELTGNGSTGVVGKIRENAGLDDLDISQTADGEASLRAGKYINENVYTDVEVLSSGETSLSINLDVSDSVTAKGKVSSEGETSLGIFFERDY